MLTPAFFSSFSQREKPLRIWRFRTVTAAAPRTAPGMDPIPPRITMARTPMDSRNVKDSGLMNTCSAANTTPMTAANEAPQAGRRHAQQDTRDRRRQPSHPQEGIKAAGCEREPAAEDDGGVGRAENGPGVRRHEEERHVAQVEQPGQADHDVEPEGQRHED